jgi:hypothetical protein
MPLEVPTGMRLLWLGFVFLAACGGGGRGGLDGGDGGGDDGGTGGVCGGLAGGRCSATEYCDFADNGCGVGDQTGTCKRRPAACPKVVLGAPTCGCDGRVYAGDCPTYSAGTDLNAHGTCDLAAGRFACGYTQCDLATQYCQRQPQPGAAETFVCVALPACTGAPSCTCLKAQPCGNTCTGDATVGLTLTCPPKL